MILDSKGKASSEVCVIHSCVVCSRFEGLPYSSVNSLDLPDLRVSEDASFTNMGIDFAGPLYTFKTSSADCNSNKAYVCGGALG